MISRLPALLYALLIVAGALAPLAPVIASEDQELTVEAIYGKELNGPKLTGKAWRPDGALRMTIQLEYMRSCVVASSLRRRGISMVIRSRLRVSGIRHTGSIRCPGF